jgi:hypothetical protein
VRGCYRYRGVIGGWQTVPVFVMECVVAGVGQHLAHEVIGVDESDALAELVRAHADLERLTVESAEAREHRRRVPKRNPQYLLQRTNVISCS